MEHHTKEIQVVRVHARAPTSVCMIGCPTGALNRDESAGFSHGVPKTSGIGWAWCEKGCPRIAIIEWLPSKDPKGRPYLRCEKAPTDHEGDQVRLMWQQRAERIACAAACPTMHSFESNLSEFANTLEEWLRRTNMSGVAERRQTVNASRKKNSRQNRCLAHSWP